MLYKLAVAAVCFSLIFGGCSRYKPDAIAYRYLRQIGGKAATDCGYVRFGEEASRTNDCVTKANKNHQPFVARYDVKGIDSLLVFALAGDGTEKVVSVKYDSEVWAQPERDGALLAEGNHVLLTPCPAPIRFHWKDSGYLACYD